MFVNGHPKMCILKSPNILLIMLKFLIFLYLIWTFPRVCICDLEANGADAVVPKREVVAMLDASCFRIVEMVELYVVLDAAYLDVDCLADD